MGSLLSFLKHFFLNGSIVNNTTNTPNNGAISSDNCGKNKRRNVEKMNIPIEVRESYNIIVKNNEKVNEFISKVKAHLNEESWFKDGEKLI